MHRSSAEDEILSRGAQHVLAHGTARTRAGGIEPESGVKRWALAFVGGKDTGNQPKSCFVCPFLYINQRRCQVHGPDIVIDRVLKDGEQYVPVCTYQKGGTPRAVEDYEVVYNVNRLGADAAEDTGLEWAKGTGTNCGGYAGGADCEHFYITDGKGIDGLCKLMTVKDRDVDWDDCCDGHEGEHLTWQEAQQLLNIEE
jgi:hypothetical protein